MINLFKSKKSVTLKELSDNFKPNNEFVEKVVTTKYQFNKKRLITFNARIVELLKAERERELFEEEPAQDYLIFLDTLIQKHHKECSLHAAYVKGFDNGKKILHPY